MIDQLLSKKNGEDIQEDIQIKANFSLLQAAMNDCKYTCFDHLSLQIKILRAMYVSFLEYKVASIGLHVLLLLGGSRHRRRQTGRRERGLLVGASGPALARRARDCSVMISRTPHHIPVEISRSSSMLRSGVAQNSLSPA